MEKLICNPLNLEYRYQYKKSILGTGVFREAADPTVVLFDETYYLFPSMSAGFWYSEDLYDWKYKSTPELPIYDYAPDVRVVNGGIVFCASRRGKKCSIYFSKDPLREDFKVVSTLFDFWDPDIFQDDDGRVYLYWGCSSKKPIWGIELDKNTMMPIGKKKAIIKENEKEHGWERVGENNVLEAPKSIGDRIIRFAIGTKPCIEGAFMTKHKGKYYIQYATPWTQNNVYSDGVYVGDDPLGPFVYQSHNPFSSKQGGFIAAAGHGSTFMDKEGKWWHTATMRISVNNDYERRIGLFPCDFDKDGIMYCNQSFSDFPFDICDNDSHRVDKKPNHMILSYRADVTASSCENGHEGGYAVDENIRTYWAAQTDDLSEWLMLDMREIKSVRAIQVNFADHKLPLPDITRKQMVRENIGYRKIYTEKQKTSFVLEVSVDGRQWVTVKDNRNNNTDLVHDLIVFGENIDCRYVRISQMSVAMGGVPAISGLRVFGKGNSKAPEMIKLIKATQVGDIDIKIAWNRAKGAIGYNVRYGIAADKLYLSYQVYDTTELHLTMINKGKPYYARVDSFNDSGVTVGEIVKIR